MFLFHERRFFMQISLSPGALAGLVATVPMTASMLALRRFPGPRHRALPPENVAHGVREILDVNKDMSRSEKAAFNWLAHFGFGAAAGAVYSLVASRSRKHPIAQGMVFGVGVWTVSYSGWIPAAGILRFPTEESKRYVFLEVMAHLVWGGFLGALTPRLRFLSPTQN
jgi:uncharacterized membrane protein YagU involved in acid resistance